MVLEGFNLWGATKVAKSLVLPHIFISDEVNTADPTFVIVYEQYPNPTSLPGVEGYRKRLVAFPLEDRPPFPFSSGWVTDDS